MHYELALPSRPFYSIRDGNKKVEGRCQKENGAIDYSEMQNGDTIEFTNEDTGEEFTTEVIFVHHYDSVKEMLEAENPEKVLSSDPKTIEHGVESYHALKSIRDNVEKFGIYALGIKPLK